MILVRMIMASTRILYFSAIIPLLLCREVIADPRPTTPQPPVLTPSPFPHRTSPPDTYFGGFLGRILNCDHDDFWHRFRLTLANAEHSVLDPRITATTWHVWSRWGDFIDYVAEHELWSRIKIGSTYSAGGSAGGGARSETGESSGAASVSSSNLTSVSTAVSDDASSSDTAVETEDPTYASSTVDFRALKSYEDLVDALTYAHYQSLFQEAWSNFEESNLDISGVELHRRRGADAAYDPAAFEPMNQDQDRLHAEREDGGELPPMDRYVVVSVNKLTPCSNKGMKLADSRESTTTRLGRGGCEQMST